MNGSLIAVNPIDGAAATFRRSVAEMTQTQMAYNIHIWNILLFRRCHWCWPLSIFVVAIDDRRTRYIVAPYGSYMQALLYLAPHHLRQAASLIRYIQRGRAGTGCSRRSRPIHTGALRGSIDPVALFSIRSALHRMTPSHKLL
jgi:hypothetical protein